MCTGCDSTFTYDSAYDSSTLNLSGKSSRETNKRRHACFRNKCATRLKHPSMMFVGYVCAGAYYNYLSFEVTYCASVFKINRIF